VVVWHRELDVDRVVGASFGETFPLDLVDDVIGRCDNTGDRRQIFSVAKSGEREEAGHIT
jgi:hypothetical protein